jgi:hypothetical protein
MFICGNDDGAEKIVGGILEQFGRETADMGKAESARAIELYACCGAYRAFCGTSGCTRSSCCSERSGWPSGATEACDQNGR